MGWCQQKLAEQKLCSESFHSYHRRNPSARWVWFSFSFLFFVIRIVAKFEELCLYLGSENTFDLKLCLYLWPENTIFTPELFIFLCFSMDFTFTRGWERPSTGSHCVSNKLHLISHREACKSSWLIHCISKCQGSCWLAKYQSGMKNVSEDGYVLVLQKSKIAI